MQEVATGLKKDGSRASEGRKEKSRGRALHLEWLVREAENTVRRIRPALLGNRGRRHGG